MGYLLLFRPGIRTIIACLEESDHPARHRQGRQRGRGDLAGSVAATTVTYGRGGIATMAMSALDIALWDARRQARQACRCIGCGDITARRLPAYGSRLLPRPRRRRHDRQGAALQGARLQGDQDAGRAHRRPAHRSRQRQTHARGGRPRHRHHDRRQHGLDRRRRDPDGPQISGLRRLLARGAGGGRTISPAICGSPRRSICASSAARRISPASISNRSSKIRGCRSCNPTRCAAASPNCARSRPSPTPGA